MSAPEPRTVDLGQFCRLAAKGVRTVPSLSSRVADRFQARRPGIDSCARVQFNVRVSEVDVPVIHTTELTYLGRLLDALEMVSAEIPANSFRDAAAVLGVPASTAHRLLSLLSERGYCERDDGGRFRPGSRLYGIAMRAVDQLPQWQAAKRVVYDVGVSTGESASFGVLVGREIVLTARHNSAHALTAVANVGDILPPHTSALGKAVLACLPGDQRRSLVGRFVPEAGPEVLRSLQGELEEVTATGYSIDEGTFAPGMRCRAVPVFDAQSGFVGGLSVSGPVVRFTVELAEAAIPLMRKAAEGLVAVVTRQQRNRQNRIDQ
jgi:IclR family acetate operon transcriptional repressor